jgi:glucosylglycerate phosphorylase
MIGEHLKFLYGAETADRVRPRIEALTKDYTAKISSDASQQSLNLTQSDVILISYGDQLRETGKSPLKCLKEFLELHTCEGISGVHILPFYPYSSDDGFSVIDYYAVDPKLGHWDDIKGLNQRFDLMFDAVFNHVSARSVWFQEFLTGKSSRQDYFITVSGNEDLGNVVRPRALPLLSEFQTSAGKRKVWTTFSADQIDLNLKNPEVLITLLDILLFYVSQGAKYIRLDAIAYLWKEVGTPCIHLPQTHCVVQLMRSVLDEVAPHVALITETNVPHIDNISYFGSGSNEAQLVYNFSLPPLVLHALLTANAQHLSAWAASLEEARRMGIFFNFLASHDGIGLNPLRGILDESEIDQLVAKVVSHGGYVSYKHNPNGARSPYELNINYFDALSDPQDHQETIDLKVQRFLVAQAIMLALAGVPGIYFHSLFGSRNDRDGAERSGIPRRINREKLERKAIEHELSDPNSIRSKVFQQYMALLKIRRSCAAFHPKSPQEIVMADSRLFAILRWHDNSPRRILCLHNLSQDSVPFVLEKYGLRLNPDGIDLMQNRLQIQTIDNKTGILLEPYEIVWVEVVFS